MQPSQNETLDIQNVANPSVVQPSDRPTRRANKYMKCLQKKEPLNDKREYMASQK